MKAMFLGFAAAIIVGVAVAAVLTSADMSSATRFSSPSVRL
jgi:hypothetical protein